MCAKATSEWLFEKIHSARSELADGSKNPQALGANSGCECGQSCESLHRLTRIRFDARRTSLIRPQMRIDRFQGWLDPAHERLDFHRFFLSIGSWCKGGHHRAALFASQDKHKRRMEMVDGILDASRHVRIDDIPCDTNHEEISQAKVEYQLG
jgi:hypothetical protein